MPRDGKTVILPASADFGAVVVGTTSAVLEFQLVATGDTDPLKIDLVGDFALVSDGCSGLEMIEGTTGAQSNAVDVELKNLGGETLTDVVVELGDTTAFSSASNDCIDLAPDSTCTIGVVFSPTANDTGASVASLIASADSAAGPVAAATSLGGFGELVT